MKYYLSLCCIIKDERYLEEFILYNRCIGVEHFYIYDNNSKYPIKDRLSSFYYNKLCTIIDFPGSSKQMDAYLNCINNYKNETNWLIVCDGDEYILPLKHNSLRDFLNEYEDAYAIGINWIMYGTSFHEYKQDGLLIDKYRYRNFKQDRHIKTICKPRYAYCFNDPHSVKLIDPSKYMDPYRRIINGPWNDNFTTDIIRINHYFGKSIEENIEKHHRGYPDGTQRYQPLENLNTYNNDVKDDILPNRYLNSILKLISLTGTNYLIYKALNPDLWFMDKQEELYNHSYNYAIPENRPLHINDKYPNFSREFYRKNYKEFSHLSDLDLELHYIYNGAPANDICDRLITLPKKENEDIINNEYKINNETKNKDETKN